MSQEWSAIQQASRPAAQPPPVQSLARSLARSLTPQNKTKQNKTKEQKMFGKAASLPTTHKKKKLKWT